MHGGWVLVSGLGDRLSRRGGRLAAVEVVGGTGAFGGNHGRAEGVLGSAAGAEGGTFVGLDFALQDQAAEAFGWFFDAQAGYAELAFGVEGRVGGTQAEAALGDLADAPPFAGGDLEDLADQLLAGRLPSRRTARLYWFSTSARPDSNCWMHISTPWRMSRGSKPVTTMGT